MSMPLPGVNVGAEPQREALTLTDIPARFDSNMLDPGLSDTDLIDGCHRAVDLGLASVLCRRARVAVAAHALAGSGVPVGTALNVEDCAWFDASPGDLTVAADRVVEDGARDLALFVCSSQLHPQGRGALRERIMSVVVSAAACGGIARVVLMTSNLTAEQISTACHLSVECGVDIVQGGAALTDDRASLWQISHMRRELGPTVLLKWTSHVRSLDWFLVACAEGVDRFWGDVDTVLDQARTRQSWGETIQVPLVGVDY
jgi:deoxyribose-phosphate aldolase